MTRILSASEGSRYLKHMRQMPLSTSRQEGAVWRSRQHRVSIRLTASYAPAPLRGPLLHGKACHWILRLFHSPTNPVPLPP